MIGSMVLMIGFVGQQVSARNLPPISKSTILVPTLVPTTKPFLKVPKGYAVDLYADNLRQPRMMAVAPNGDIFVVLTRVERKVPSHPHDVIVLSGFDRQGIPQKRSTWTTQLDMPFGIQFGYGHVYVANTGSVVRWKYQSGQTEAVGEPEVVIPEIPNMGYRNHWTRNILFGSDMKSLFLTIGSEQNIAEEGPRRAVIEKYDLNSQGLPIGTPQTYARGMRNPVGLAIQPVTRRLWANVVERDYKGDDLVPDFMTEVKNGGFYGWPYSYIGSHHDSKMPKKPELEKSAIVPDVLFPAHSSPIDVKFAPGGAIVALHGSQNRSKLNGYKVVFIPFNSKGKVSGEAMDFVTGWLPNGSNKEIYGRPAGMALLKDGSILITDDWGGKIWRVRKVAQ